VIRHVKAAFLALLAIFALGAVASASASASELPEFRTATNGTTSGGEDEFVTKAGNVKCAKETGEIKEEDKTKGTYTFTFSECREPKLKLGCRSLGDDFNDETKPELGTILLGGTWTVLAGPRQTPSAELLLELTEVHVECSNATLSVTLLFLLKGDAIGLITPEDSEAKEFKVEVETTKAEGTEQKEKTYENDSGTIVEAKLEDSIDGGATEAAGDDSSAVTLKMEKDTEIEK